MQRKWIKEDGKSIRSPDITKNGAENNKDFSSFVHV